MRSGSYAQWLLCAVVNRGNCRRCPRWNLHSTGIATQASRYEIALLAYGICLVVACDQGAGMALSHGANRDVIGNGDLGRAVDLEGDELSRNLWFGEVVGRPDQPATTDDRKSEGGHHPILYATRKSAFSNSIARSQVRR